jgi:hypothetical protein
MNRSIVLAAVTAFTVAACTATPEPDRATSTPPAPGPATSVVTEVVTHTVTNPAKPDDRVGYGALKLGMTLEEAKATGLAGTDFHVVRDGQCTYNDRITVTAGGGVERIVLPKDARTSAGIAAGSTLADVKKAYPNATEDGLGYFAEIPGDARFLFETADTLVPRQPADQVTTIKLFKRRLDCTAAVF